MMLLQVIRDNEPNIAGHSASTFKEHYDQKSAQTTHKVVDSLQLKRDTITPLLNVPTRPSVGEDRKARIIDLQNQAKEEANDKLIRVQEVKKPVETQMEERFTSVALQMDSNWISERRTKSEFMEWTFLLCCRNCEEGEEMRECIRLLMERRQWVEYLTSRINSKKDLGKVIRDSDKDCLHQVKYWYTTIFNKRKTCTIRKLQQARTECDIIIISGSYIFKNMRYWLSDCALEASGSYLKNK